MNIIYTITFTAFMLTSYPTYLEPLPMSMKFTDKTRARDYYFDAMLPELWGDIDSLYFDVDTVWYTIDIKEGQLIIEK
jgi:hypothetical protein